MKTPTHCSKPMRRSETKKGNPWWCSECGEYIQRWLEWHTNKEPPAINMTWVGPVAPQGNRLFRISDDGISIDGSKIEESEVETHSDPIHDARGVKIGIVPLRPWATGEFKTKEGRMFRGKKMDPGAGWEIEETTWIDPLTATGDALDEIASTFGIKRIPTTTPSLTPATFRGVPFPTAPDLPLTYREKEQMLGECLDRFTLRLVSKSHGTMLAIHYDMTQDEMESVESELKAPVCRYIWARVSKEDFEAL